MLILLSIHLLLLFEVDLIGVMYNSYAFIFTDCIHFLINFNLFMNELTINFKGLHFKWENLPKSTLKSNEDFVKPILSPTMAGGLFAINRAYFKELGEYDNGMNIWGGENLEISFRVSFCALNAWGAMSLPIKGYK